MNARGHACSENTVAKLMRGHGIRANGPRPFVRTTDSNHRRPVAANVRNRDFAPPSPDAAWSADITDVGNRVRLHSSLGFVSPVEFERAYHQTHR